METLLQKELKQSKPFRSVEAEAILNIARTAEVLASGFAQLLKPVDLTPTQYNALRILRGAGADGLSCREISERMVTKDSDITRLLDRLESRGLIMRERPATDRRRIVTRITDEGLRLVAELDEPVAEYERQQVGHLGTERLTTLNRLLEELRSNSA